MSGNAPHPTTPRPSYPRFSGPGKNHSVLSRCQGLWQTLVWSVDGRPTASGLLPPDRLLAPPLPRRLHPLNLFGPSPGPGDCPQAGLRLCRAQGRGAFTDYTPLSLRTECYFLLMGNSSFSGYCLFPASTMSLVMSGCLRMLRRIPSSLPRGSLFQTLFHVPSRNSLVI